HPDIAYDGDGDPYIAMTPGNVFAGIYILFTGLLLLAVIIPIAIYNGISHLVKCLAGYSAMERNKKPVFYQYDRYLANRDPELVDHERRWVRYTTAVKEPPNPARSHLFDYGNGEKGIWEYRM
ncbi:MAG: hypothetical protein ACUVSK_10255, partial [Desulfotomaculales bacterium]